MQKHAHAISGTEVKNTHGTLFIDSVASNSQLLAPVDCSCCLSCTWLLITPSRLASLKCYWCQPKLGIHGEINFYSRQRVVDRSMNRLLYAAERDCSNIIPSLVLLLWWAYNAPLLRTQNNMMEVERNGEGCGNCTAIDFISLHASLIEIAIWGPVRSFQDTMFLGIRRNHPSLPHHKSWSILEVIFFLELKIVFSYIPYW